MAGGQTPVDDWKDVPESDWKDVTTPASAPTTTDKVRNFLLHGNTETHPSDFEPKTFDFPPAIKNLWPIGLVDPLVGLSENPTAVISALRGGIPAAAKAAAGEVRPLLSGLSPFRHPFKVLPDLYDAGKNILQAGSKGMADFAEKMAPKPGIGRVPLWRDIEAPGIPKPPEPPSGGSAPPTLPSGRVVGRPAFDTDTGDMVSGIEPSGHFGSRAEPIPIERGFADREAARLARVKKIAEQVNWQPPKSPVDTSAIPVKSPANEMTPESFIRSQIRPVGVTPPESTAHPPFAPDQPFSPSRAVRQMTPAKVVGIEPTGVRGNPKAQSIAEQLRKLHEENQ